MPEQVEPVRITGATVSLSRAAFTGLGAGDGDPGTRAELRRSQLSRHLLLLREVVRTAAATGGPGPADHAGRHDGGRCDGGRCDGGRHDAGGFDVAGWYAVLSAAEQVAPAAVRRLLGHPPVGAWAAACLTALRAGRPAAAAGVGHLGAVAAAAALVAGLDTTVRVPVAGGLLPLPTLGAAALPGAGWAVVDPAARSISGGGHRVAVPVDPAQPAPGWLALRRLATTGGGPRLAVFLDDLDPYRAGAGLSATGRLPDAEVAAWQSSLDDAWRLLLRRHPEHAAAIAGDLRTVVPLHDDGTAGGISATSKHAFGAVALSAPADPTALAVGLLHETRHGRLNAVQYLFPLVDEAAASLLYSPWRDDPRPPGGLLHGAYAYLAVTDFWRVERQVAGPIGEFAFARWRTAVADTTAALLDGPHLTAHGRTFAAAMLARTRRWLTEPVPPAVADLAGQANTDHRLRWRLRHLVVDPSGVRRLAGAWCAGRRPDAAPAARVRPAGQRLLERNDRLDRIHARLRGAGEPVGGCPGDRAYACGDEVAAAAAYRAVLARRPDDPAAWAGLALTTGLPALLRRPELVAAVYRTVRDLHRPAPRIEELAGWLEPVGGDAG